MPHEFLTPEWIEAAREIRARHADEVAPPTVDVRVNLAVTEVPFGDGDIVAHLDTSTGVVDLDLGAVEEPHATITLSHATARALLVERDPAVVMQAFMTGQVLIEGDIMRVMALQAGLPDDEVSIAVAEEIVAITAGI